MTGPICSLRPQPEPPSRFSPRPPGRTVRTVTSPLDKLGIFMPDQVAPGG
jgi:hypothetical protein